MDFILSLQIPSPDVNFGIILPELIICGVAVLIMLLDAFARPSQRWITGGVSLAGLVAAAIGSIWLWTSGTGARAGDFNGMIVLDSIASQLYAHILVRFSRDDSDLDDLGRE